MKQQQASLTRGTAFDWLERAVLTYGPRKAGTTLLQNLLDGGDQLFAYPAELKLKTLVRRPIGNAAIARYVEASRIARVPSPHLSPKRYQEAWDAAKGRRDWQPDLRELIRLDVMTVYSLCTNRPQQPTGWCAKDVGGDTDAIMQAWRSMFPKGRAIFIVRNPLMVTRAVLQDRRRKSIRLSVKQIIRETLDPLRVMARQATYIGDPDVFVIAYEDLVRDPTAVMATIACFLEIAWTPCLAVPTIFGEPVVVRTASRAEKGVFQQEKAWTDDLTLRERLIVGAVHILAKCRSKYRVDYSSLRQRVAQQVRAAAIRDT